MEPWNSIDQYHLTRWGWEDFYLHWATGEPFRAQEFFTSHVHRLSTSFSPPNYIVFAIAKHDYESFIRVNVLILKWNWTAKTILGHGFAFSLSLHSLPLRLNELNIFFLAGSVVLVKRPSANRLSIKYCLIVSHSLSLRVELLQSQAARGLFHSVACITRQKGCDYFIHCMSIGNCAR